MENKKPSNPALEPQPDQDDPKFENTPRPLEDGNVTTGVTSVPTPPPTEKQTSKFQVFLRKALTWLVVVAVAFLAGVLTLYFTQVKPLKDELANSQTTLEQTNTQLVSIQDELDQAILKIDDLTLRQQQSKLLEVLVDVYAARLALTNEDTEAAITALLQTSTKLDAILEKIAEYNPALATTLPARLNLVQTNIEADPTTAIIDSDLIIQDLLEINSALFSSN